MFQEKEEDSVPGWNLYIYTYSELEEMLTGFRHHGQNVQSRI